MRASNQPYVRSFQYKVLNYILFTNDRLFKIAYVSNPNCTFCQESRETFHRILFQCSFSKCFWNMVSFCILHRLGSCRCLSIRNIMIGILKEGMDWINYAVILGKHICGPVGVKELILTLITSKEFWKSNMKQKSK